MAETSDQNIVINDLLSFLTCKSKLAPKEKLLSCINKYYSEAAIVEAQKALLAALPIKKSTRHGRRVKHPDTLVAIYDCIQLIPKDDLPIFVCKDLDNVPHLKTVGKGIISNATSNKNMANREVDKEDDKEVEEEEMNDELYRKEQKQMRLQISEMFSIITELKNGLQKYNKNSKTSPKKDSAKEQKSEKTRPKSHQNENINSKYARFSYIKSENKEKENYNEDLDDDNLEDGEENDSENEEEEDSDLEENSKLDGLALIQKLIDQDDETNKLDLLEKEFNPGIDMDDDPDYIDEFDELENFVDSQSPGKELTVSDALQLNINEELKSPAPLTRTVFPASKPSVVVAPSESGQKIIYIKNEFQEMQVNESDVGLPGLSSEIEKSIEIDGSSDFMGHLVEMEDTQEQTHRIPPLYGSEEQIHVKIEETEIHVKIEGTEESEANSKKRTSYKCHYCMEVFTAYRKLRKHMNIHCIIKNSYDCVLCHHKFASRDELRKHFSGCLEKLKHKYTKNICNVCKTFYASDKALKQHKNLHEEFRPHPCPHCSYKYLNKATLDAHVKNQHSSLNKFVCPFCPHTAIANAYLSKHIRVHTGEAPFECKTCGHKAKTKFLLKRHMELHGPLRERKCDKCSFVCVGLNEYLRHRRKQHGKPIVCHICKLCFKQSSTFVRHYNLHTQKKPYKCDQCLYTGTVKESLRLHTLTHAGSNPQVCPECNVSCINRRNLRRHLEHYCNNLQKLKQ